LVDRVQQARDEADGLIVNPAADTFTSIGLPDA
jgi:3-dehydroquinate dehydratase